MKRIVAMGILFLLLTGSLSFSFSVHLAKASGPIYIRADGSIDPSTAPIQQSGDVYTLTGNIASDADGIVIERDGVTLDGVGYTVQGTEVNGTNGIFLSANGVTIKHVEITSFDVGVNSETNYNVISDSTITSNTWGIWLGSYNTITGNRIIGNAHHGIELFSGSYNTISDNEIIGNDQIGIRLNNSSDYNSILRNSITENTYAGIYFDSSDNNNVWENTVEANHIYGVCLYKSSNNKIYHNSIADNPVQTLVDPPDWPNIWDYGYPSAGNYWSDYTGLDVKSGPNQDQPGGDGIGDAPYVIDSNNTDHYPLVQFWSPLARSSTSVTCLPNPVTVGSPATCTATVSGSNPIGTVTWSTSSSTGIFSESTCTLSSGTCSTMYIDNFTGFVTIAASYSGDSNNMPSSGTTTLTVTSGGPVYYSANYTSVQAAIDAAPSGATVIIAPGFYSESLTVNKTLTIIGEKDLPVFGGGASAIYLTLLSGASGSTVTGIEITNVAEGILVVNASNVSIYGNIMASIGGSGIVLEGNNATHNVIYGNIFQDTPTPINLTASASGNAIYGNIITSQTSVTLNIGADGNVVYGNSMSGSQILLNVTNSHDNIFYHNNFLATVQLTVLATGNNTWDNGYPSGGNYWNNYGGADVKSGSQQNLQGSDGIGDTPYVVGNSTVDHYPLMKPWTAAVGHFVEVLSVVIAKTVIGQGSSINMTVCVVDNGEYAESFSVTAYANATAIGTRQVSGLNASCQMVLTFAWNTAGLAYGNYTVGAYAQPVAGQTDVSGNDFTLGTLKVTIPGDVNGDFRVGLPDLVLLAQAYGSKPRDSNWNLNADIDGNNALGLSDLVILAQHYGQHYP